MAEKTNKSFKSYKDARESFIKSDKESTVIEKKGKGFMVQPKKMSGLDSFSKGIIDFSAKSAEKLTDKSKKAEQFLGRFSRKKKEGANFEGDTKAGLVDSQTGEVIAGESFSTKQREKEKKSFSQKLRTTDIGELARRVGEPILRPPIFRQFENPSLTKLGQGIAAILLPIVIMVSLILLEVFAQTIVDVALNGEDLGQSLTIVQWLVTLFNLALFSVTAWIWFQWVRTGGFGLFAM